MSLKTFHIFFISLSVLMCLTSAGMIWILASDESWAVPGIIGALMASVGLVIYGRSFLRRYRNILPSS